MADFDDFFGSAPAAKPSVPVAAVVNAAGGAKPVVKQDDDLFSELFGFAPPPMVVPAPAQRAGPPATGMPGLSNGPLPAVNSAAAFMASLGAAPTAAGAHADDDDGFEVTLEDFDAGAAPPCPFQFGRGGISGPGQPGSDAAPPGLALPPGVGPPALGTGAPSPRPLHAGSIGHPKAGMTGGAGGPGGPGRDRPWGGRRDQHDGGPVAYVPPPGGEIVWPSQYEGPTSTQGIKLPRQTRVMPDEYKEFLSLGHGEVFEIDLDRVVEAAWRLPTSRIEDYFNYDMKEREYREYQKKVKQYRAEFTFRNPIQTMTSAPVEMLQLTAAPGSGGPPGAMRMGMGGAMRMGGPGGAGGMMGMAGGGMMGMGMGMGPGMGGGPGGMMGMGMGPGGGGGHMGESPQSIAVVGDGADAAAAAAMGGMGIAAGMGMGMGGMETADERRVRRSHPRLDSDVIIELTALLDIGAGDTNGSDSAGGSGAGSGSGGASANGVRANGGDAKPAPATPAVNADYDAPPNALCVYERQLADAKASLAAEEAARVRARNMELAARAERMRRRAFIAARGADGGGGGMEGMPGMPPVMSHGHGGHGYGGGHGSGPAAMMHAGMPSITMPGGGGMPPGMGPGMGGMGGMPPVMQHGMPPFMGMGVPGMGMGMGMGGAPRPPPPPPPRRRLPPPDAGGGMGMGGLPLPPAPPPPDRGALAMPPHMAGMGMHGGQGHALAGRMSPPRRFDAPEMFGSMGSGGGGAVMNSMSSGGGNGMHSMGSGGMHGMGDVYLDGGGPGGPGGMGAEQRDSMDRHGSGVGGVSHGAFEADDDDYAFGGSGGGGGGGGGGSMVGVGVLGLLNVNDGGGARDGRGGGDPWGGSGDRDRDAFPPHHHHAAPHHRDSLDGGGRDRESPRGGGGDRDRVRSGGTTPRDRERDTRDAPRDRERDARETRDRERDARDSRDGGHQHRGGERVDHRDGPSHVRRRSESREQPRAREPPPLDTTRDLRAQLQLARSGSGDGRAGGRHDAAAWETATRGGDHRSGGGGSSRGDDRDRSDRGDRERIERERSDRERSDRERSDRDKEKERSGRSGGSDRDRQRGDSRDKERDRDRRRRRRGLLQAAGTPDSAFPSRPGQGGVLPLPVRVSVWADCCAAAMAHAEAPMASPIQEVKAPNAHCTSISAESSCENSECATTPNATTPTATTTSDCSGRDTDVLGPPTPIIAAPYGTSSMSCTSSPCRLSRSGSQSPTDIATLLSPPEPSGSPVTSPSLTRAQQQPEASEGARAGVAQQQQQQQQQQLTRACSAAAGMTAWHSAATAAAVSQMQMTATAAVAPPSAYSRLASAVAGSAPLAAMQCTASARIVPHAVAIPAASSHRAGHHDDHSAAAGGMPRFSQQAWQVTQWRMQQALLLQLRLEPGAVIGHASRSAAAAHKHRHAPPRPIDPRIPGAAPPPPPRRTASASGAPPPLPPPPPPPRSRTGSAASLTLLHAHAHAHAQSPFCSSAAQGAFGFMHAYGRSISGATTRGASEAGSHSSDVHVRAAAMRHASAAGRGDSHGRNSNIAAMLAAAAALAAGAGGVPSRSLSCSSSSMCGDAAVGHHPPPLPPPPPRPQQRSAAQLARKLARKEARKEAREGGGPPTTDAAAAAAAAAAATPVLLQRASSAAARMSWPGARSAEGGGATAGMEPLSLGGALPPPPPRRPPPLVLCSDAHLATPPQARGHSAGSLPMQQLLRSCASVGSTPRGAALPPPPPPPRSAAPTPSAVPPSSDVHRFLAQATLQLPLDSSVSRAAALSALKLSDVWAFYQEHSAYGREVQTLGGARGQSTCYFLPYLSGMQLFVAAAEAGAEAAGEGRSLTPTVEAVEAIDEADVEVMAETETKAEAENENDTDEAAPAHDDGDGLTYTCAVPSWPRTMRLRYEFFEGEAPHARVPLFEHIQALASVRVVASATTADAADAERACCCRGGEPAAERAAHGAEEEQAAVAEEVREASGDERSAAGSEGEGEADAATAAPRARAHTGGAFLNDMRVSDVHPASWFAVAWYPVYRIPDAALTARFLTYHAFASLIEQQAAAAAAEEAEKEGKTAAAAVVPSAVQAAAAAPAASVPGAPAHAAPPQANPPPLLRRMSGMLPPVPPPPLPPPPPPRLKQGAEGAPVPAPAPAPPPPPPRRPPPPPPPPMELPSRPSSDGSAQSQGVACVPVCGVKWNNVARPGEHWLVAAPALVPAAALEPTAAGTGATPTLERCLSTGSDRPCCVPPPPPSLLAPASKACDLAKLLAAARRLSSGAGLRVLALGGMQQKLQLSHPDFEFFDARV
ncbi:hypothetical protein FOA52_007667 [Chlamydomonas sp. UWO 241]|nr:hypothetical protein FOA52_007667 [Chlamydomonas sp. UWO 241]